MPATSVGKLYFEEPSGTFTCSATVISAPNESTVWTAGHCVSDGKGDWYSDFVFQPDRHGSSIPFGEFRAQEVAAPAGWVDHGEHPYDMAALVIAAGAENPAKPRLINSGTLQDTVGAQGIRFGTSRYTWPHVYIFGYPGSLEPPPVEVDDTLLRYCISTTGPGGTRDPSEIHFRCNMGPGSSGGPLLWDLRLKRGWGYLIGNVSYGYENSYDNYSPQLGDAAVNLYNEVKDD